ncbi:MAG TPA: DUF1987 domain-containing protein [Bacteroidales bacterium]
MENIVLKGTPNTPIVNFDASTGVIELTGKSIPEDPFDFYAPLLNWIDGYSKLPCPQTKVIIKLDYINSSSFKLLLQFLKKIERLYYEHCDVALIWYCEEDDFDMVDAAGVFKSILKMPFEIIETL